MVHWLVGEVYLDRLLGITWFTKLIGDVNLGRLMGITRFINWYVM